jgi:hypothetical protein
MCGHCPNRPKVEQLLYGTFEYIIVSIIAN